MWWINTADYSGLWFTGVPMTRIHRSCWPASNDIFSPSPGNQKYFLNSFPWEMRTPCQWFIRLFQAAMRGKSWESCVPWVKILASIETLLWIQSYVFTYFPLVLCGMHSGNYQCIHSTKSPELNIYRATRTILLEKERASNAGFPHISMVFYGDKLPGIGNSCITYLRAQKHGWKLSSVPFLSSTLSDSLAYYVFFFKLEYFW